MGSLYHSAVENLPESGERAGSVPGSGRSLGEVNEWQPTLVFLPGKSHGQRSLVGYHQSVAKESDTTEKLNKTTILSCLDDSDVDALI